MTLTIKYYQGLLFYDPLCLRNDPHTNVWYVYYIYICMYVQNGCIYVSSRREGYQESERTLVSEKRAEL